MNKIFYFTATGNCMKIAEIIAAGDEQAQSERITADTCLTYDASEDDSVGIVYPVYCGNAPEVVRDFVRGMQLPEKTYFWGIATHGGHCVVGCTQIAAILNQKNHLNYGLFDVEMIHNGAFIAPVPEDDVIRSVTDAAYEKAGELAERIRRREVHTIPDAENTLAEMAENPMAKMIVLSFHPNEMGKTYFLNGDCIHCGTCEQVCPMNNIVLTEKGPVWGDHCQLCMGCLQWCPKQIIQFSLTDFEEHSSVGSRHYHNPDVKVSDLKLRKQTPAQEQT